MKIKSVCCSSVLVTGLLHCDALVVRFLPGLQTQPELFNHFSDCCSTTFGGKLTFQLLSERWAVQHLSRSNTTIHHSCNWQTFRDMWPQFSDEGGALVSETPSGGPPVSHVQHREGPGRRVREQEGVWREQGELASGWILERPGQLERVCDLRYVCRQPTCGMMFALLLSPTFCTEPKSGHPVSG